MARAEPTVPMVPMVAPAAGHWWGPLDGPQPAGSTEADVLRATSQKQSWENSQKQSWEILCWKTPKTPVGRWRKGGWNETGLIVKKNWLTMFWIVGCLAWIFWCCRFHDLH